MKMKAAALKLAIALTICSAGCAAPRVSAEDYATSRTEFRSPPASSAEVISIQVNGHNLALEQPPVTANGSTLVPFRSIFEELGAKVEWDGNTSTVTASKGLNLISLTIGSNTATRNSEQILLDAPPVNLNGSTLVPVRFIAESLGAKVEWSADTRTVRISTQPEGVSPPASSKSAADTVLTGTFAYPWTNPLNFGTAEVSKLENSRYHLHVSVVHGFSHSLGELDSDFTFDGKAFIFSNPEYSKLTMAFTENSITIDYPGDGFGGYNAEPKGTFYLQNSGIDDAPFLTKLYTDLQIPDSYRHGFTDVYTYHIGGTQDALLVRSRSSINRSKIISENLAIYDTSSQSFEPLGEITGYTKHDLGKKLEAFSGSEELIYELLNKEYADRFTGLQMQKFDDGDRTAGDPEQFRLTDAEAFYVVTGSENTTSISENFRDQNNIGSIFRTEVDHSDADSVTIHIYELVRNGKNDEHTATIDWLEVNRSNGRVKSILFK
ncbi:copper amine oxidase N-terminal domain-containing protein [Paenibacillus hamazuiensis]|uniref:copper amine oxidase N-terminal domain-containing protein n=1 Tax=Paenibacillus hamazuiensis TaxID=2936508 RepID=UPI00200DE744|nr:copper amine oxidase N-terminal domain-containing protein [Paenibacillus hamazuiensis]